METVLIAGGNGLIGKYLSQLLIQKGYQVTLLSRKPILTGYFPVYQWNPDQFKIDQKAITTADHVINLAGANIGEKRWTNHQKQVILNSRVQSGNLLTNAIRETNNSIKTFISASAVGYYGCHTTSTIYSESDASFQDFLGETCLRWESISENLSGRDIRIVTFRTGIVLAKNQGALKKLIHSLPFGIIPVLGNGKQYMPWIHIQDLCNMYLYAIQNNNITGCFNAVAPQHITQNQMMHQIRACLKKGIILHVSKFLLQLIFGEMAHMLLEGSRVSSVKIGSAGFQFSFPDIQTALTDLLASTNA